MATNKLTLLNGSRIVLDEIHSALVPEVFEYDESAPVVLENDQHEYLGTAEITDVKVETFALLQAKDLQLTSHPETTSWSNALHTLATQVEGFSQLDKVSIVTFYVHAVTGSGITVTKPEPTVEPEPIVAEPEPEPEVIPTVEEQYAALDTVSDVADAEGNQ